MTQNTADLINAVRTQETIPDSGAAYSDQAILQFLNMGMNEVVGAIQTVKEDYFVETKDYPLTSQQTTFNNMPANIDNVIKIPAYSSGLAIHDVTVVGTSGGFTSLPRITSSQAAAQQMAWWGTGTQTDVQNNNAMAGFYLQGNSIQIFPYTLAQGNTFRIDFRRQPNELCSVEDAGQVISKVGDVITINGVRSWTPGLTRLCAVSNAAPHQFVEDATIPTVVYCTPDFLVDFQLTAITSNVITLPAGIAANIEVGDWICPTGQSVFAQNIPQIFIPALIQKAAAMVIHAAGDQTGEQMALSAYKTMMKQALLQISPRVDSKPIKALPTNGPFRASRRMFVTR